MGADPTQLVSAGGLLAAFGALLSRFVRVSKVTLRVVDQAAEQEIARLRARVEELERQIQQHHQPKETE